MRRLRSHLQAGYVEIAKAGSFDELAQIIGDRQLSKGTRVRFKLALSAPVAPALDAWGAEKLFLVPEGMKMVDVWGEGGSTGYIELEADPAWLLAVLLFIKAHWVAIVISTLVLGAILTSVTLSIKTVGAIWELPNLTILALVALGLYLVFGKDKKREKEKR